MPGEWIGKSVKAVTSIVSLEDVSRYFEGNRVRALENVSLEVVAGEFLAIVGPSGCGKSTLLHLASGLDSPTTGRVYFEQGIPASLQNWRKIRATRIGFVFQAFHLLSYLTAAENVEVPMIGVVANARSRRQRAHQLLRQVGLANRLQHKPQELSGGERQRVAVARAMANTPDLIVADEPTGNLDSASSIELIELLEDLHHDRQVTLIMASHDPEITGRANRVVTLVDGRVAEIE